MEIYDIYREQYEHHIHHGSLSHRLQQQQQRSSSSPPRTNSCDEVLDLSRRCDSVETRKTPSPYATGSSLGTDSPSTNCGSPANSTTSTMTPNSILSSHERHQNKSVIMPTLPQYPIYYPAVKRENSSPPSSTVQAATSDFSDTSPAHLLNPISLMSEHIQKTFSEKNYDRSTEVKSPIHERLANNLPLSTNGNVSLIYPKILMNDGKPTRPFKAFPRDPLVIAANFAATDVLYDSPRVERYTEYRKRVLEQIRSANGGQRTVTNPKMRRTSSRNSISRASDAANAEHQANSSESDDRCTESSDNDASSSTPTTTNNNNSTAIDQNKNGVIKDAAYYERRRKNNAAAKKSRDRRRIKEDEIAIRAAYLERQNIELLCQLDALKAQLAQLTKQQC